jgi:phospholipase/lecithinase/hemolysin
MEKNCHRELLLLCLVIPFGSPAFATTYENLLVFGDSLSDTGNVARFSDGEIWVETLANSLGANLYNYAYGGATTGYDNPAIGSDGTGLLWQINKTYNYSYNPTSLTGNSLVSVWAGANDFLQSRDAAAAATNIGSALAALYADGFRDFLVPNLPDIGTTPYFQALGAVTAETASAWTLIFNTALEVTLSNFTSTYSDTTLYALDIYGAFAAYPPENINAWTAETQSDGTTAIVWNGTDQWGELFWTDGFHPSSDGHALIASLASAAVPEPTTMMLLGLGLLGLAGIGRRSDC